MVGHHNFTVGVSVRSRLGLIIILENLRRARTDDSPRRRQIEILLSNDGSLSLDLKG